MVHGSKKAMIFMALTHQATEKASFDWSALFLMQESIFNLLSTTSSFIVIQELVVSLSVHLWKRKKKALEMCCIRKVSILLFMLE